MILFLGALGFVLLVTSVVLVLILRHLDSAEDVERKELQKERARAYVVATVKRGTEHRVAEKIRKMKEVTEVLVARTRRYVKKRGKL